MSSIALPDVNRITLVAVSGDYRSAVGGTQNFTTAVWQYLQKSLFRVKRVETFGL